LAPEPEVGKSVGNVGELEGGLPINTDQMKGNWKQLVGKAKEKWGRLTDDDWKIVEGKRDQLVDKCRNVMELFAKKQSVRYRLRKNS
jgi:uncharacterized protein YjbJ (UPF0337 family)